MKTFLDHLLGTTDVPTYLAALFFAFLGLTIVLLLKAKKRDKYSEGTPYQFSLLFLIQDNLREILLGFLMILAALRFSMEYAGEELTMWYAFGIGLGFQKLSEWLGNIESNSRK